MTLADAIAPLALASELRVTGGTGPVGSFRGEAPRDARAAYDGLYEVLWLAVAYGTSVRGRDASVVCGA